MERPSILERLRAFNRWTKGWAASIAVAVGIWIVLRSYLIEAFRIPSASMENTLLIGDFLFVNKAVYGGELEVPLVGFHCCRLPSFGTQIGRASCRESVEVSVRQVYCEKNDTIMLECRDNEES